MRYQDWAKRETCRKSIPYIVIAVFLFVIAIIKTRVGIHSDEIHSIAVADMIARGDKIFKDCWFYLQLSAVISAPIIWLYRLVLGSADGLILFLRIISVLIQTGISLFFYQTFSKHRNRLYVFVASVCLFMFVPDFLSFGYKPEMIWFTILEIIFAYRYCIDGRKINLVLLGISLMLCVLAFPTAVLHLLVWTVFILLKKSDNKTSVLYILMPCLIGAIFFFAFTFNEISLSEFLRFFPEILKDDQLASNFITKLIHPVVKITVLGIMSLTPILIAEKVPFFSRIVRKLRIPVIAILLVVAFIGQCYIERLGITWHCITYPYALTFFFLPYVYHMESSNDKERNNDVFFCFTAMAWVSFLCFSLASNQGNLTSIYAGVISAIGLLVTMAGEEESNAYRERTSISIVLFIISFYTFSTLVWDQEAIYPEIYGIRTVFSDRVYIDKGPAKGILVGQDMYDNYMNLCDVIDDEVTRYDRVYIIDSAFYCSFGYLYQPGYYAVYSPRGEYYDRIVEYYDVNPDRRATVVIISKNYIKALNGDFPYDREIYKYLSENSYIKKDSEYFVVFKK